MTLLPKIQDMLKKIFAPVMVAIYILKSIGGKAPA